MKTSGLQTLCLLLLVAALPLPGAELPVTDTDPDSAVAESNARLEEIARYREQLAELESQFGPYDGALEETLAGLTDALIELGEFEEAQTLLGRRLQLSRTQSGPANDQQMPVLKDLIGNSIRLGRWRDVTDQFQFIQWLNTQVESNPLASFNAMNDVAKWQMAAVYLEEPRLRIHNFLDARQLQREIVYRAEDVWGEDSLELIPWLYAQALNQYRLYGFVTSRDELGYAAFRDIQIPENMSKDAYLRKGLNIMKRIRKLAGQMGDAEADALAMLYEADFQTLMHLGTGMRLYRDARDQLLAAGLDAARVNAFFATPKVIPVGRYFFDLDSLQQFERQAMAGHVPHSVEQEITLDLGTFTAWNESLPGTPMPELPEWVADLRPDFDEVTLVIDIDSRGIARNPKTLWAEPDTGRLKRNAKDAMKELHFRPVLGQRRTRRVNDVLIHYRYPAMN